MSWLMGAGILLPMNWMVNLFELLRAMLFGCWGEYRPWGRYSFERWWNFIALFVSMFFWFGGVSCGFLGL